MSEKTRLTDTFLGGELGDLLKEIDAERHFSLFMKNPRKHLIYKEITEIAEFARELRKLPTRKDRELVLKILREKGHKISFKSNLFYELTRLLNEYTETTTRNAAIVAEKPKGVSVADIIKQQLEKEGQGADED